MKNLFYKIFNPDKYLKQKQSKIIELDTKIFREKYEKQKTNFGTCDHYHMLFQL